MTRDNTHPNKIENTSSASTGGGSTSGSSDIATSVTESVVGQPEVKSKSSATTSFGTSFRESHDASAFYSRFVSPKISADDTVVEISQRPHQDTVALGTAEDLLSGNDLVADNSVALVVTSPPYFVGKDYETDIASGHIPQRYEEHLENMRRVFELCVNKLEPGGRIAVNVANLGRKPYRSQSADIIAIFEQLQLLLRGEVIWRKGEGMNSSTAWGSFQRPSNPVLRDLTERVIIASKGRFDRALSQRKRQERGLPHEGSLFKDEFMSATKDVWDIASESARRIGHPAPFPVGLPQRLIELYTYRSDLILDPYMGSGTTAIAALRSGRNFVGCEAEEQYVELSRDRIEAERMKLREQSAPKVTILPSKHKKSEAASGAHITTQNYEPVLEQLMSGAKIDDVVSVLLDCAGFEIVAEKKKVASGLTISFIAQSPDSSMWYFDIVGSFSSDSAGMSKTDAAIKAIGRAALHRCGDVAPKSDQRSGNYVILTNAVAMSGPSVRSINLALADQLIFDIAEVAEPSTLTLLARYAREGASAKGPNVLQDPTTRS